MKFCNNICTRFLSQIKRNSGPQGGTWQYKYKIDMDPRVYNFRVIHNISGNNTKYVDIHDYRRCRTCEILYKKSWGLERCRCCNNPLTIKYHRGGRQHRY